MIQQQLRHYQEWHKNVLELIIYDSYLYVIFSLHFYVWCSFITHNNKPSISIVFSISLECNLQGFIVIPKAEKINYVMRLELPSQTPKLHTRLPHFVDDPKVSILSQSRHLQSTIGCSAVSSCRSYFLHNGFPVNMPTLYKFFLKWPCPVNLPYKRSDAIYLEGARSGS